MGLQRHNITTGMMKYLETIYMLSHRNRGITDPRVFLRVNRVYFVSVISCVTDGTKSCCGYALLHLLVGIAYGFAFFPSIYDWGEGKCKCCGIGIPITNFHYQNHKFLGESRPVTHTTCMNPMIYSHSLALLSMAKAYLNLQTPVGAPETWRWYHNRFIRLFRGPCVALFLTYNYRSHSMQNSILLYLYVGWLAMATK